MEKNYYVYILASKKDETIYVGTTSDLLRRVGEHKSSEIKGFTEKYSVTRLVHYEVYSRPEDAFNREKRLKFYKRQWKIDLIENANPDWMDLYETLNA